ncbi:MAG: hypothetical protein HFJ28_01325 [Clostridia bacterium]|nr:hypothetical protein [Clostridia bacterium]
MTKKKLFFNILLLIFILLFISSPIILATDSILVWSNENNSLNTNETALTSATSADLKLDCGSAILIEQHSGKVLYDYNMHEKLRPASVTKVMTILLIMEAIDSRKTFLYR